MKRRVWIVLGAVLAVNFLILLAQSVVSFWPWRHLAPVSWLFPETRYFVQGFVVLIPLIPVVALKFRFGKALLALLVVALTVHAAVFLVKAHIPTARRHQYVEACDWAVERIRADYRGPKADAKPFFSWLEYHPLSRPCVESHTARVAYELGGRWASLAGCGFADIPDYIVDETSRVNRVWWQFADYEVLAERTFGKRDFIIYKRIR